MKAILIEEERFAEFCELAKLEAHKVKNDSYLIETLKIDERQLKAVVDQVYRSFHFNFVRWAQSHGASCVRK